MPRHTADVGDLAPVPHAAPQITLRGTYQIKEINVETQRPPTRWPTHRAAARKRRTPRR
jgi:hypothetical protein